MQLDSLFQNLTVNTHTMPLLVTFVDVTDGAEACPDEKNCHSSVKLYSLEGLF